MTLAIFIKKLKSHLKKDNSIISFYLNIYNYIQILTKIKIDLIVFDAKKSSKRIKHLIIYKCQHLKFI